MELPIERGEIVKVIVNNGKQEVVDNEVEEKELWKILTILGYENYKISSYGRIYSMFKKHFLKLTPNKNGYVKCSLVNKKGAKKYSVHVLVAKMFHINDDPINKTTVDHINRIRYDNRASNLRWATRSEQNKNRIVTKTDALKKEVAQYDLNGNLIKIWKSLIDAANELNISSCNIGLACRETERTAYGFKWKYTKDKIVNLPGEEWRESGFPEYLPFLVSNMGRIINFKGNLVKGKTRAGYIRVNVYEKSKIGILDKNGVQVYTEEAVHRLVIGTFKIRNDILQVNHENGVKNDNRLSNLEYVTPSENQRHAVRTGLIKSRPRHQKPVIQKDLNGKEIARFNGVREAQKKTGINHISNVCRGVVDTSGGFKWEFAEKDLVIED